MRICFGPTTYWAHFLHLLTLFQTPKALLSTDLSVVCSNPPEPAAQRASQIEISQVETWLR